MPLSHTRKSQKLPTPIRFPEILPIDELALYVRLSRSSLYHYSRTGKIPGRKIGRHWRYHKSAIDLWIKNDTSRKFRSRGKRA